MSKKEFVIERYFILILFDETEYQIFSALRLRNQFENTYIIIFASYI